MRPASGLQVEPDAALESRGDGLAEASKYIVETGSMGWTAVSALAAEYTQAVRRSLSNEESIVSPGNVQQESRSEQILGPEVDLQTGSRSQPDSQPGSATDAQSSEAAHAASVQSEAARVAAKVVALDLPNEVILRFDFITAHDSRVALLVIALAEIVGIAVLFTEFAKKFQKDQGTEVFFDIPVYIWNISIASICLLLLSGNIVVFAWRAIQAHWARKTWSPRRKRNAILFFSEAVVQWINLAFFVVPNAYMLQYPCKFYAPIIFWSGWIRWTMWNTLFALFLAHAHGSRYRGSSQIQSRPTMRASEHSARRPEGSPALYLDGTWSSYWPILLPWALLQAASSVAWLRNGTRSADDISPVQVICSSGQTEHDCEPDAITRITIFCTCGFAIVYFAAICYILRARLKEYRTLPYSEVQVAIVFYRLQFRLRILVMLFFAACLVLLFIVRVGSCRGFQFSWFGILPMQIVMTANAFVWSFITMPHTPAPHAAETKVWEQEFAWTEAEKPLKLAARALAVPDNEELNHQPMFCFETMMHLVYWSCLVYDYKRDLVIGDSSSCKAKTTSSKSVSRWPAKLSPSKADPGSPAKLHPVQPSDPRPSLPQPSPKPPKTILTLGLAKSLYSLTDHELFWETKQDTRCLLGWNKHTIVVAFRGTVSLKNAFADIQAWRVPHPPNRGSSLMFSRPLVHVGYMKCWLAGGFNLKVLSHIKSIVDAWKQVEGALDGSRPKYQIFVTGHSLGGALATLAAYDIRKQLLADNMEHVQVVCYSFGAPRTGNHAFAQNYNAVVPDTYSVINDQDVVTRGAKFVFLYKRPGRRVIVNDTGRMMVCPSYLEQSVQQDRAGQSVDQHFMTSYYHAILSVILAQFTLNGFSDGMQGIIRLAEGSKFIEDMMKWRMGMTLDNMRLFAEQYPGARPRGGLGGAHLPARGFYRVKTVSRDQLQAATATSRMTKLPKSALLSRLFLSRSERAPEPDQEAGTNELEAPEAAAADSGVAEEHIRIAVRDT